MNLAKRLRVLAVLLCFFVIVPSSEASSLCLKFLVGATEHKWIPSHLRSHFKQTTSDEKSEIENRFRTADLLLESPVEIERMLALARGELNAGAEISVMEMVTRRGLSHIEEFLKLAGHEFETNRPQLNVPKRTTIRVLLGNLGIGLAALGASQLSESLAAWVLTFGGILWNGHVFSLIQMESAENHENETLERIDGVLQGSRTLRPRRSILVHRRVEGGDDRVYVLLTRDEDGELILDVVRWAYRPYMDEP